MSLQIITYGLVLGSILSLGAMSVSLTFGNLRFANFAQGDIMMVGAYTAYVFYITLNLPLIVSFIAAIFFTSLICLFIHQSIFKRLQHEKPVILLISSFGVALMLRSIMLMIWGPDSYYFSKEIQTAVYIPALDIKLKSNHLTILIGTFISIFSVHLLLKYTRIGKAMRAFSDNPELTRLTGINTETIIIWTWAISGSLAAICGTFLAMDTRVNPEIGWNMLLLVFAAAILGGIGRPYGAIAGGLLMGVLLEFFVLYLPEYKLALAFAIMVLTLVFRPAGIFSGRSF